MTGNYIELELGRFNTPNRNGRVYALDYDSVCDTLECLMTRGEVGIVSTGIPGGEVVSMGSAGKLVAYEATHAVTTGEIHVMGKVELSDAAIGIRNLFPDLTTFSIVPLPRRSAKDAAFQFNFSFIE